MFNRLLLVTLRIKNNTLSSS